ncbi:LysR family transcriptional regulator [Streptomyces sp. NPDC057382]|uniref:LysR family transcriptional regulator n=1 Tax=unclassified Streptomyces TaxID=2593676 RepID=UPI00363FFE9E
MTAVGEVRGTVPVGIGSGAEPSIHQLRLFLVLGETRHFGRAAASLFISQSALSQQIRGLENRLGVRLFDRTNRTVDLTDAGRTLLPVARAAVDAMVQLRRTAQAQVRRLSGRLVVGTVGAEAAMPYTHAVLRALREDHHPQLTVDLVTLNAHRFAAALEQREVDVVFLRPPVPEGIELHRLAGEPRVACLPADDPLAALPGITLAQLAGRPVVDWPAPTPREWRDFWAADPRPDGSPVRYGPVVTDMETLLHTVARGEAMCFLPAAARDLFPRPGVRYVDVRDLPRSTAALAWLTERRDEPAVAAARHAARAATGGVGFRR